MCILSSGVHTVHQTATTFDAGVMERTWSYKQRGLIFAEEFPEYDTASPETVEISNIVAWDDAAPITDVEWSVSLGNSGTEKTGNTSLGDCSTNSTKAKPVRPEGSKPRFSSGCWKPDFAIASSRSLESNAHGLGFAPVKWRAKAQVPG